MSALLLANSGAGELTSAVTAGTTSPSLSALTPEISKVMGALQRNFEIEKQIKSLGDAHRVFQLVRGKIADEFTIIDGVPKLNPGSLERCAGMTVRGLRDTLFSLLEERKGVIMELHTNRDTVSQIVKQVCVDFDLGRLSNALSDRNAHAPGEAILREIERENGELEQFTQEGWEAASAGAKYSTNRYEAGDGRFIYRKADGGFSLHQKECATYDSLGSQKRPELAEWSFSPEMYQRMPVIPDSRSLHCEHEPLEQLMLKYLGQEVERLLDVGAIGLDRAPDFLTIRLNPLLSECSMRGRRYLEILRGYTSDELSEQPESRLAQLALSPRVTIASETLRMMISCLNSELLSSERHFQFLDLFRGRSLGSWVGPFAKEKNRRIIHEAAGESTRELIREGKLFFNNYPILSLNQFRDIARSFSSTPSFAETMLSIYDRTLVKGIDMGLLMQM
jgi:hypothetical protein